MDHDGNTEFSYHDAMVLYCIQSHRQGMTISDILGFQDMIDRSYSTSEDLDLALRRFMAIELITINNGRFLPTQSLLNWKMHEDKKTYYTYDAVKQIEAQLNALSAKVELDSIPLPDQILDEGIYASALTQYHQSFKRSNRTFSGCVIFVGIAIIVVIVVITTHIFK